MKTETKDFSLTSFSNYFSLEDAYIYKKLGEKLGLGIRITEASIHPDGGVLKSTYESDCTLRINLSGSAESMDEFNRLWNKIDRYNLKRNLQECVSVAGIKAFHENAED